MTVMATVVAISREDSVLQVEEHYKVETKDYLTTIKRLQEENRKLSSSLTGGWGRETGEGANRIRDNLQSSIPSPPAATERDSGVSEDEGYIEIDLVNKLQARVVYIGGGNRDSYR